MGANKWVNSQILHFLNNIEGLLPTGRDQWDSVPMQCHKENKKLIKNGESCKKIKINKSFHKEAIWHCEDHIERTKDTGDRGKDIFE